MFNVSNHVVAPVARTLCCVAFYVPMRPEHSTFSASGLGGGRDVQDSKDKHLELLARHLGLLQDRVDLSGSLSLADRILAGRKRVGK